MLDDQIWYATVLGAGASANCSLAAALLLLTQALVLAKVCWVGCEGRWRVACLRGGAGVSESACGVAAATDVTPSQQLA